MREKIKTDVGCAPDFYKGAYAAIEAAMSVLSEYKDVMTNSDIEMRLRALQDEILNALLDVERENWIGMLEARA